MPNTNDKNQKQLNVFLHTKCMDAHKGFTLVELMVTLAILGILLTLSVSGLLTWRDWSDFNRVNEYAETMFLSAQNQLSEYSANGTMQDFRARVVDAGVSNVPVELITAEDGLPLTQDIDQIAASDKHYIWMSENKGTLVCVRAEKGDYSRYLQGADTNSATAPFVFELLDSYIYDQSLLNETICIEFSLEDGQVFSVLFTDKCATDGTTEYSRFVYTKNDSDRGDVCILDRQEAARKQRMTGYYGVDTLSKAIQGGQKKISISDLELHNSNTLFLSFGVSNASGAVSALNYDIVIYDADEPDKDFLSFTLSGTKLKNAKNREIQNCVVTRHRYEASSNSVVSHNLGEMPILAWINDSGKIEILLDAADFQANSKLYGDAMDIMLTDGLQEDTIALNHSVSKLMTTYSFHRFGLDVDHIYCEVKAYGSAYKASPVKQSNTEAVYFDEVSFGTKAENSSKFATLSIGNARHLYNVRYLADFSKTELAKYWSAFSQNSDLSIKYQLTDDINWATFVEEGYYYDTKQAGSTVLEGYEGQFVSIKQLGAFAEFDGDSHTITGMEISEVNNASSFLYADDSEGEKPVGFVCTNFGSVHDLSLDQIKVYSNSDKVGAFCGVNVCSYDDAAGTLYNLEVLSSGEDKDKASSVTGKEHVGGIVGYLQGINDTSLNGSTLPAIELSNLKNEAKVTGIKYIGGIVGEVRTPHNTQVSVTITDCENKGAVYARTKVGTNNVDAKKCGFIGGITGYAANMYEAGDGSKNTNLLRIVDCVSVSKYDDSDIATLLDENLNGVYVGGIVGYNYYGQIENCSTKNEDGDVSFVFGHSFVGGITGYNCGSADGSFEGEKSINTANVIGVKYVGGITGCNADLEEEQEEIEALETIATPKRDAYYDAELLNWQNKGYVFAKDSYAGGISGVNTGWIYNCDSKIDGSKIPTELMQRFSGDYVGGIVGYNNGIIGNTLRDTKDKTLIIETASADERRITITSNISGTSYVGGIVGYNDEQAVVEDYAVDGGFVRGTEQGCFVGGYVGFNASLDLLQSGDGSAKSIEASPSSVYGGCFVGGILGGNIINTSGYTAGTIEIPVYSAPAIPEVTDDESTDTPAPILPDNPTENPTNDFTLSFDRTNAYLDGNGIDIISQYSITALPKNGASVSDWRIEIDIPDGVEVRLCQAVNHTFQIRNNKLIITPLNENDYLPGGGLGFSIYSKSSIDYFKFTNSEVRLYVDNILRAVKARTLTNQVNRDFTVSLTPYGVWQNETGKYIAGYNYSITNTTDKMIEGWGFEIDVKDRDFEVYSGWIRYEHKNGKLIIVPQFVYNNTILPGETITGQFQIIGDTEADVGNLQFETIHKYEYYEAASSKPNEPPVDLPAFENKYAIATSYSANNTEEIVSGNAFVGGFIGYNLLIDNSNTGTEYGYVNELSKQILNAITGNSGSLTAQYHVVDAIDSIAGLTSKLNVSDIAFVINGQTSEYQVSRLNKIEGNICVGGIVGFSNEESRLYIKNTTNNTPIFANQDIADTNNSYFSYAGGIIGMVGSKTVLENCSADSLSMIASKGDYCGTICETNNGFLLNCSASVIYSNARNYSAGLCGLNQNKAMIKNCSADKASVIGQEMAGALVAVNYGYIQNPSVNSITVVCAGAAGGVAAYNGESGIILLVHNMDDINISSTGDNVGGIVGINDGVIVTASAEDDYKITVTGSVSGHDTVGGIVGKNAVHNDDSKIGFFANYATVTAEEGNVGGIVGYNQKINLTEGRIADCDNYGTVTAKGTGYAGGICAVNDMKVLRCKNYGELFAAEGKGDGIVAFNRDGATVFACESYQTVSNYIETNTQSIMSASNTIPVQEMPEITDSYEVSTSDNLIYTFSWDIDKDYENAVYDTKLLGFNKDGSFDLLGEQTNLVNNTASFEDVLDIWDYAKLKLIVTRQGRYDKATNQQIFENSGEKEFQSKVSLSTIPVSKVLLSVSDNGKTNRDSLVYAVSFAPIQTMSEKQAISYYKILVRKPVSLSDGSVSYDVCYEKNIYPEEIDDSKVHHTEILDLSKFEEESELNIAVKAIARKNQEVYRDSRLGGGYVLTVPKRLEAIDATTICSDIDTYDAITETELNRDGITLSVSDDVMAASNGNYELAVAIFDSCDALQTDVANAGDFNPNDDSIYWNSGARITIASKSMPLVMDGNTLDYATCVLGSNLKLSDYAGKWLKIAARRTGDEYLNSAWSDEDANGETVNYLWVQIPQVMVDMPLLSDKDCLDTKIEYYDGVDWSSDKTDNTIKKIEQRAIVLKESDYADSYSLQIVNDSVRKISIVKRPEGNNTVFDVYYIGCDSERITGVIGEPYDFWKYLGTLDGEQDIVDLPFQREFEAQMNVVSIETDDGGTDTKSAGDEGTDTKSDGDEETDTKSTGDEETDTKSVDSEETGAEGFDKDKKSVLEDVTEQPPVTQTIRFSKCASVRKTNDGFILVLPYEWNEFNGKVTVQACVNADDGAYLDSQIGCYASYFDNMHREDVFTIEDSFDAVVTAIPKVSATVDEIDQNTIHVTYNLTSNSDLIMAQIIVLDENNNMKWTEYKQICMDYNTVDERMHGSFTIDAKEYFASQPKQTAIVRFTTMDSYGLGVWTDFYELTFEGLGSMIEL